MRHDVPTALGTIVVELRGSDVVRIGLDELARQPATHGGDAPTGPAGSLVRWLGDYARHPTAEPPVAGAVLERWLAAAGVGGFTRTVLLELAGSVPAGETITYGELARRVGSDRAARACGSAMARNPVPLLIPCHRVVPAAGGVGPYSAGSGSALKARLLQHEGAGSIAHEPAPAVSRDHPPTPGASPA